MNERDAELLRAAVEARTGGDVSVTPEPGGARVEFRENGRLEMMSVSDGGTLLRWLLGTL